MTVIQYVTEEVERQGHDTTALDGIQRVGWMLEAWAYAIGRTYPNLVPAASDAIHIGKLIEPEKNKTGLRTCGVRVGAVVCPPASEIESRLFNLFRESPRMRPLEFYHRFEEIHPFVDGNGRTGKVLLNWLNGSLLDPVFPPDDFWGRPIRNP